MVPVFSGVAFLAGLILEWSGMEIPALVLFWVGSQSAVMVPDRAFTTIEARDEAIAFARARIVATSSMPGRP